ncbi:AlpA family phage regulatory protein [Paraburkholderia sp. RP-4-7]|uniref:AlpA family phage regulatory protein n=1 Tax=Paraburkholderia polaris TaxID=2728848 RepID=A0A848IJ00_9BURK|nr:AlpA family phage regulatory protein [Paraburkholderia polaris]
MAKRVDSLPLIGLSRWKQIEPFVGVSRETWRKLCLEGRAPRPIRLSPRCTVWDNCELLRYLADPLNYQPAYHDIHHAAVGKAIG